VTRLLLAVVVLVACGQPKAPRAPSPDVRAEIERAEQAERARRHDVAREHYERAVTAANDPASIAFARREYAETLMSWGEFPAAITQLEAVVAVRPDHAASWHDLGLLRNNRGDRAGAIAAFERARAIVPTDPRPRIALAQLRFNTGDLAGARAEYQQLLELELPDRVREKVKWMIDALAKERSRKPHAREP
jgi:tetratricopeptide (TPR) repeat protein